MKEFIENNHWFNTELLNPFEVMYLLPFIFIYLFLSWCLPFLCRSNCNKLRQRAQQFRLCSFSYVHRKANQVVHRLTRHVINVKDVIIWTDTSAPFKIPYTIIYKLMYKTFFCHIFFFMRKFCCHK